MRLYIEYHVVKIKGFTKVLHIYVVSNRVEETVNILKKFSLINIKFFLAYLFITVKCEQQENTIKYIRLASVYL